MTIHGSGTFSFTGWDEATYSRANDGSELSMAKVTNDFRGAIEGVGTVTYVLTYLPDGDAVFLGYEQIVGQVAGRSGSFVVVHDGRVKSARFPTEFVVTSHWRVVPGSGSGELGGLSGSGEFIGWHEEMETPYTFDYELG